MVFTSPFGPHMVLSSIKGGYKTADSELLRSPVPEPSNLVLSAVALCSLLCLRRFKGRRA
jgi:hypothetical protein